MIAKYARRKLALRLDKHAPVKRPLRAPGLEQIVEERNHHETHVCRGSAGLGPRSSRTRGIGATDAQRDPAGDAGLDEEPAEPEYIAAAAVGQRPRFESGRAHRDARELQAGSRGAAGRAREARA